MNIQSRAMPHPAKQSRAEQLPDIYPQDGSGALRWPDGTIWMPALRRSGVFGRTTRRDRRRQVAAMESQIMALERAVTHYRQQNARPGETS